MPHVVARITRPRPAWSARHPHIFALLIALDELASAATGGAAYSTVSSRMGFSMEDGGWASHVPWPAWWRAHCLASEETVTYVHSVTNDHA